MERTEGKRRQVKEKERERERERNADTEIGSQCKLTDQSLPEEVQRKLQMHALMEVVSRTIETSNHLSEYRRVLRKELPLSSSKMILAESSQIH